MINIKDQADVQIWCDYQEEIQQTNANYFLRLRFSNFRTFLANVVNYGSGNGYGDGWDNGDGCGYGFGTGYGLGWGDGYGDDNGIGFGIGFYEPS